MYTRRVVNEIRPYKPADSQVVQMNANESSLDLSASLSCQINRYPDSDAIELRRNLGEYLAVEADQIIAGNGSSEMIELIMKTYLDKDECVMSFDPTFTLYKRFTQIYGGRYIGVKSKDFIMDEVVLIRAMAIEKPKLIFICNPNNPTGAKMSKEAIEKILKASSGLVIVDEAYMEFSEGSMLNRLDQYENLIILRTFSKAWGLAGIRLGYLVTSAQRAEEMMILKSPYNLNVFTLKMGIKALSQADRVNKTVTEVQLERERVYEELLVLGYKTYRSAGNFLFFMGKADLGDRLRERGIGIRDFNNGSYRVTIGSQKENDAFLKALMLCSKEVESDDYSA